MKKRQRKGQGAMEYLMTYGWALLVIVVVGAALFALGVLNPGTYTQKRCQGFQYFTYQDHLASNANGVQLNLVNGPKPISIDSVTWGSATSTAVSGNTAAAGAEFVVTGTVTTGAAAAQYSNVVVTITYDVTGGIQNNVDRATCSGTYAA